MYVFSRVAKHFWTMEWVWWVNWLLKSCLTLKNLVSGQLNSLYLSFPPCKKYKSDGNAWFFSDVKCLKCSRSVHQPIKLWVFTYTCVHNHPAQALTPYLLLKVRGRLIGSAVFSSHLRLQNGTFPGNWRRPIFISSCENDWREPARCGAQAEVVR